MNLQKKQEEGGVEWTDCSWQGQVAESCVHGNGIAGCMK